jgi:hypothetical protein
MTDRPVADEHATHEVGSEGGSEGELEVVVDTGHGVGSEAGETWSPSQKKTTEIRRDETGEGKRTP